MSNPCTRRSFLAAAAAAAPAFGAGRIPVGLELYSVRDRMKDDVPGTVRAVGKMGYQGVEFYGPYFDWTPEYAKEIRKVVDDSGMKCYSTHNGMRSVSPEGVDKAIELNKILGSQYVVVAGAGKVNGLDGWKRVAETLNKGNEKLKAAGMRSSAPGKGYRVLIGEGDAPWKKIFEAAEKTGGVEYYLIEQEGSDMSSMETAEKSLALYKRLRS
jgi:sugar phosphate isomerase/epimerase